ncbi:MAG: hypothetical protein WB341_04545 [Terracidiphilus sp.]
MSLSFWMPPMRRASLLAAALLLAAGVASAQSTPSQDRSSPSGYSSSQAGLQEFANLALPDAPAPDASASAGGSGAGQYGNGGGSGKHGLFHNLAFEASGGFNAPQSTSVTYGGQFTVGGGVNFSKRLSALIEYQFLDAKLPGYLIAEADAQGGHAHIWSFTVDPVVSLFPKSNNDFYVTGGGGFYRKVSSFTDPEEEEECYYFCEVYEANVVIAHFSSNQGGFNIGGGFQHRVGGTYGDSKTALFAEARYVDVLSPAVSGLSPNGSGLITTVNADTKIIPVSLGIRF